MVEKDTENAEEKNSDDEKSSDSSTEQPKITTDEKMHLKEQEAKPQVRSDSHQLGADQNY